MARVQFSALINSIQGSVGGSVFQRNKSGFTLKNKYIPGKARSIQQANAQVYLSQLISLWQSLTEIERNEWNLFSNYNPYFNKNNSNVKLTGYQLFLKYNLIRMHSGLSPISAVNYISFVKLEPVLYTAIFDGELFFMLDPNFNSDNYLGLISCSQFSYSEYPVKAKSYKVIPITDWVDNYSIVSDLYTQMFGTMPVYGVYIRYKVTICAKNSPYIIEGNYGVSRVGG